MATINRTELVRRFLVSLNNQNNQNFILIIVDQNHDNILFDIISEFDKKIHILHLRIPACGVSVARNYGIKYIPDDTEIVSFPDDDCIYPPNTLDLVCYQFKNHDLDVLAGINVPPSEMRICKTHRLSKLNKYNIFKNGPTYVFFYKNKLVNKISGFDPHLGPSPENPYLSSEDTDFSIRAIINSKNHFRDIGLKIAHPEMHVFSDLDYLKCLGYAMGRKQILKKHSYPIWFILANIIYPLYGFLKNIMNSSLRKYYLIQFIGRL